MRKIGPRLKDPRVELVTGTFVASGTPEGIHDLGRFLENLNGAAAGRHIELASPAIRPLYRASASLQLDAPLLIRREDIIFANFDGPHFTRGVARPSTIDVGVLLMAPPFQLQGVFAVQKGADATQALRFASQGYFSLSQTRVFDADGAPLGEGDTIVVNGAAIAMMSATKRHISVIGAVPAGVPGARRAEEQEVAQQPAATKAHRAA